MVKCLESMLGSCPESIQGRLNMSTEASKKGWNTRRELDMVVSRFNESDREIILNALIFTLAKDGGALKWGCDYFIQNVRGEYIINDENTTKKRVMMIARAFKRSLK